MEESDVKTKKTDKKIRGIEQLFDKIEQILNGQEKNSFVLNAYYFNLEKPELNYSIYIKFIKHLYLTLSELLEKEEVFYFENGKFFSLNKQGKKNNNNGIVEKIKSKKIIKEDHNSLLVKKAAVKWPGEATNFDQMLKILDDKIYKQNKFKFPPNPNSILINRKEDYLDKVEKRSTQLYLLAKNNNIEVIKQHIEADKTFQIAAGEENSFELFYILEGTAASEDEKVTLEAGDSITAKSGEGERYFKTLTEVDLLYISSTPIFASEQKKINNLMDLNKKIAKKDNETHEHCDRLQRLSRLTAEELNLDKEKLFNLGFASFLHDIGKVKVPASILQKPGKLTKEEWGIMKKHTEWGKEILLDHFNNKNFRKVAEVIYQHHERFDGKGYPQGLKGDEILIEAQILTIVDAYDAMVYERPYQRAFTREEALAEIKREKGKQFAPRAVEAFLKAEKKFFREN
ncbi:MAG: HD domain-containing phosphohydrolase [Halanaerobium sp.]